MAAASVAAAATPQTTPTTTGEKGKQSPSAFPILGSAMSQGCFSSAGKLEKIKQPEFMAMGSCTKDCIKMNMTVSGISGNDCYCGNSYPAVNTLVDDAKCNYPCPFYPIEACGGISGGKFFGIFNNGITLEVQNVDSPASSTPTNGPSSTGPASTLVVTQTSAPSTGPNVGGIAAGVVCSILAVAGIIGGVFFYMRRQRNKELEDEHRRNAAVNAFINGAKPPGSSGGLSMADARMDPGMAHRRMSDGSIADNQDYSRKILRVTN